MLEIEFSYNWMYISWIFKKIKAYQLMKLDNYGIVISHKVSIKVKDSIIKEYDRNPFLDVNSFK